MADNLEVDVRGAVAKLKKSGINVHVAVPKLVSRLKMQGERFMKQSVPVDTGYLMGSVHSGQHGNNAYIKAGAEYAGFVNYRAKKTFHVSPKTISGFRATGVQAGRGSRFMERTEQHILKILPVESDRQISKALKGMTK